MLVYHTIPSRPNTGFRLLCIGLRPVACKSLLRGGLLAALYPCRHYVHCTLCSTYHMLLQVQHVCSTTACP